jgi:hypothetical protein
MMVTKRHIHGNDTDTDTEVTCNGYIHRKNYADTESN